MHVLPGDMYWPSHEPAHAKRSWVDYFAAMSSWLSQNIRLVNMHLPATTPNRYRPLPRGVSEELGSILEPSTLSV